MYVLRHRDISHDHELVTAADLFEELEEEVAALPSSQQRTTVVTTEGDEMKISGAVVAV